MTVIFPDEREVVCEGRYYADGRVLLDCEGDLLLVDPRCYHPEDAHIPKFLNKDGWAECRIKSVVLDSKFIVKNQ